jgi:hypothetical protein
VNVSTSSTPIRSRVGVEYQDDICDVVRAAASNNWYFNTFVLQPTP